ncbi:hypothetical protein B0H10DRAFT_2168122 [Mycena sp. CBHHK59/15]|nr:hypothetical protein B0H10DRAFT_2168122 [Mycena sp. CBHHK59/15]
MVSSGSKEKMNRSAFPKMCYEVLTRQAQLLVAAENSGASTDSFDFSSSCAKNAWKIRKVPCAQTHKELCEDNKRHMLRKPEFSAILLQFPWGRLEKDGTFCVDVARGRFKVLGSEGFGFWSHRGGPVTHLLSGSVEEAIVRGGTHGQIVAEMAKVFNYLDGTALLEPKHLTDRDGWKLEPELIPFLIFSSLWSPPRLASKESPAALLMHYPMSIYWLLVDTLQVVDPKTGSAEGARVQLNVQYIGAEVELNFLPLFSELALLLPYTDIKLVMFGVSVRTIVSKVNLSHPNSLAVKASATFPVYSYTAPEESGSGRIQIFLHGSADLWVPADAAPELSVFGKPDAIVAPNAGLGSYPAWCPAIIYTHATEIPFGVTEYAEQSCETQLLMFPRILEAVAMMPGRAATKQWNYQIKVNPFQRPGQRAIYTKVPNVPSGFTIRVVGRQ